MIQHILRTNRNTLKAGTAPMNKFFKETNEQLVRNNLAMDEIIISYIDSLRKKTFKYVLIQIKKVQFQITNCNTQ